MLTDKELQSLRNLGNEAEAAADEIVALRARINMLDAWHDEGVKMLEPSSGDGSLGLMFLLGQWWADRPWRRHPC